jgi:nitroimidazol reductase NimA-like FMN-containing flavoprotein (pyridoxamine 5'-phosphate oxidase superfamily)
MSKESVEQMRRASMNAQERQDFVRRHRTALFGYTRQKHGPATTVVYYIVDDQGDILVTTMEQRAKTRAVERNPKVSMCILDEQWPLTYLMVYCDATIDRDFQAAVDLEFAINGVMAEEPMPESKRSVVEDAVRREQRIVLRLTPYSTFETPPRHVHNPDDLNDDLTHWLGVTLPWDPALQPPDVQFA